MQRRQLLKSTAAFSAASVLGAPAIAQAPKKITFLTWNLVHLEAQIKGWIQGFIKSGPASRSNGSTRRGPSCRPTTRPSSPPARRPTSSTSRARSASNTPPRARCST